ncbi:KOW domain-containing RNA-binding protein [Cuneatibacter caecimuris]|uniref:Ribosomal protein L14E/L6E/L27E n=1 Tax=Cuneatibacter caecimuris TaxID=1796618 RepID=A0A4Q7PP96_9FIRM|nr:KOW domain-containing RNA-binding protein [Cuneatibacter caecimuris]RZT02732.1 hypothetical protein EV209_0857 [Cuneatibacter caecimuris]
MKLEAGSIVRSLAGHDADCLYVVMHAEEKFLWVSDGRLKQAAVPKKKNRKHVEPAGRDEELARKFAEGRTVRDEEIKRALKLWKAYHA